MIGLRSLNKTRQSHFLLFHLRVSQFSHGAPSNNEPSFEDIGVNEYVIRGMNKAFPHIKTPTPTQEKFIPTILSGKDVLIQDKTGTGKSLGLLLALLSKGRAIRYEKPRYWKDRAGEKVLEKEAITSILIVPHNDLAHQFFHWVKSMRLTRELDSVVQTLLKDPAEPYEDQLARLAKQSPHILIATPQALEACWNKGRPQFTLDAVSTIVLEEADSLLKIPSNNTPASVQKRWRKHPPVVRDILTDVFKLRPKVVPETNKLVKEKYNKKPRPLREYTPVQLILSSATLRPAIRKHLFLETKWLSQEPEGTVTIEATKDMDRRQDPVRHYGLFVDVYGNIRNIMDPEADSEEDFIPKEPDPLPEEDVESSDDENERLVEAPDHTSRQVVPNPDPQNLLWNQKRVPSQVLDAAVSIFAMDVPSFALLIIPSNVSALRTVEDLNELGVKAINLDDYVAKPGETLHRLGLATRMKRLQQTRAPEDNAENETEKSSESTEDIPIDDPIMLVAIQGAVRGIDLPLISHVFIVGVPESDVDYLHLAGRVGRMGARAAPHDSVKKVITFLPEPNVYRDRAGRLIKADEPRKDLEKMWKMLEIKPSVYAKAL
ncbi:P-loop containing nucleoside triphosphate hydrolase protein [Serendipita vermifera]|nr:P-loop containing nucleoside triphosphate hydrolase protein [Serendipita vermifera]